MSTLEDRYSQDMARKSVLKWELIHAIYTEVLAFSAWVPPGCHREDTHYWFTEEAMASGEDCREVLRTSTLLDNTEKFDCLVAFVTRKCGVVNYLNELRRLVETSLDRKALIDAYVVVAPVETRATALLHVWRKHREKNS